MEEYSLDANQNAENINSAVTVLYKVRSLGMQKS